MFVADTPIHSRQIADVMAGISDAREALSRAKLAGDPESSLACVIEAQRHLSGLVGTLDALRQMAELVAVPDGPTASRLLATLTSESTRLVTMPGGSIVVVPERASLPADCKTTGCVPVEACDDPGCRTCWPPEDVTPTGNGFTHLPVSCRYPDDEAIEDDFGRSPTVEEVFAALGEIDDAA